MKPKPDELLTSWVARSALSFGLTPYNYLKYKFESPKASILDYDRVISKHYLNQFSKNSGLNRQEILDHTIKSYAKSIIDVSGNQSKFQYRDILPKSKLNKHGLMYCPLCLKDDPYFKISWRLTLNVACPVHKIKLVNCCPHCSEPVRLELLNCFLNDVSYCFACWRSLTIHQALEPIELEIENFTTNYLSAIKSGWFTLAENVVLMSPVVVNGIWALINTFYSKRKGIDYFKKSCNFFGIESKSNLSSAKNHLRFGSEYIEVRYDAIRLIALILNDWPDTFIKLAKEVGITKCIVNPHGNEIAYWLHMVCSDQLHTYIYRFCDDEMTSVLDYMIKYHIQITRSGLARALGIDESMKLNSKRKAVLKNYQNLQTIKNKK